jgi:hypothetical protein
MDDLKSYSKVYDMSKKTTEIFFVQLICLDDYKNREDTLNNFNDENVAKYFIENQINKIYNINKYLNNNKENDDNNKSAKFEYEDKPMIFLFKNDFCSSTLHLLRYLKEAIINVFTPYESKILNYFQTYVNHYFMQKSYHNKNNNNLKLD